MNDDAQQRLSDMEDRYLELQAASIQQSVEIRILLTYLVRGLSEDAQKALTEQFYDRRRKAVAELLRHIADDTPNLAAQLRQRLDDVLGEKGAQQ